MAKKPTKPSPKNNQYDKEIRRLKRLVEKAEQSGYIFDKSPIPPRPKRVTQQSIDKISKIDIGEITKRATKRKENETSVSRKISSNSKELGKITTTQPELLKGHLTEEQKEVRKQIRRIKGTVKGAEKRGYTFDIDYDELLSESSEYLKSLKGKKLYKEYGSYELPNGDVIRGDIQRKKEYRDKYDKGLGRKIQERAEAKRIDKRNEELREVLIDKINLPRESTVVLDNIREILRQWTPLSHWGGSFRDMKADRRNTLENILENTVATDGEIAVARRLQNASDDVASLVNQIIYDSEKNTEVNFLINRFTTIVTGRALTMEEAMELSDLAEGNEDFS